MRDFALVIVTGFLIGFAGVLYLMRERQPVRWPEKQLLSRIVSGEQFSVLLDSCPYKDKRWRGADNPLGDIACDAAYRIAYRSSSKEWVVTGPNAYFIAQGNPTPIQTYARQGPDANERKINMWGLLMRFDDSGHVYDPAHNRIGHIAFDR
jgi:hypothetical protein